MTYKIDDDIPIPDQEPEEILPEEDTRWVPFKPNQPKCPGDTCSPQVGRCLKCGDIFPCPSGNCGHFNCADPSLENVDCPGNGTETPEDFYYVVESETDPARTCSGDL